VIDGIGLVFLVESMIDEGMVDFLGEIND